MNIEKLIKDIQDYIYTLEKIVVLCGSVSNDKELKIAISVEGNIREITIPLSDTNEEAFNKVKDMINT